MYACCRNGREDARIILGWQERRKEMLQVELLQYKIVRLDMVDMIKEGGRSGSKTAQSVKGSLSMKRIWQW